MDFYAILDQVVALLRQRQRVASRALKRRFALDDDAVPDLTGNSSTPIPRSETMRGEGWSGRARLTGSCCHRRGDTSTGGPRLHPTLSRGENSHLPQCAGRRAQTGDGAVCRPQRLDGIARRPRPRGGAAAPRPGPRAHDGGRASLRRDGQPGHGRWHHGAVWGAAGA